MTASVRALRVVLPMFVLEVARLLIRTAAMRARSMLVVLVASSGSPWFAQVSTGMAFTLW